MPSLRSEAAKGEAILTAMLDVFADTLTEYVGQHYGEFSYLLPAWMRPFATPSAVQAALGIAKRQAHNLPTPVKVAIWRKVAQVLNLAAEQYAANFVRGRQDKSLVELLKDSGLLFDG